MNETKLILLFYIVTAVSLNAQSPSVELQEYLGRNSQNLFSYDTARIFPQGETADDFGPRQLNRGSGYAEYDWHGGIDYNANLFLGHNDLHTLLLAVQGGNIDDAGVIPPQNVPNRAKRIFVEGLNGNPNFAYVHIFGNGYIAPNSQTQITSGGSILKYMDAPYSDTWVIIFQINGNYTAIGPDIAYPMGTPMVTFARDDGNQATIPIATSVNQGDPIAPLGDSGTGGAHLHLQLTTTIGSISDANSKNPLAVVDYNAPIFYDINFYQQNDANTGIDLVYPGTSESTIQVRIEIPNSNINPNTGNRYDRVMDIDEVEIFIKSQNLGDEQYQLIQGPNFSSKLSLGGRLNSNRTLSNGLTNQQTGDWSRTHMQPFAYAGLGTPYTHHPWDDFYFADFVTRIHKTNANQIALCPNEARYPDGVYDVYARITTARSRQQSNINTPSQIEIDNFQPFIQSVQAQVGGTTVYEKEWTCADCTGAGGISFTGENLETSVTYRDLEQGMQLVVQSSEPLQNLFLSLPELAISNQGGAFSNDRTEWTFNIETSSISTATIITFQFTGMDFNENSLLALQSFTDNTCTVIPVRSGLEMWSVNDLPTGMDESHSIGINCGMGSGRNNTGTTLSISSDDCLVINTTTTNVSEAGNTDGAIVLTVEGGTAPYQYVWDNGAMTENIDKLSEGQYCVTIIDSSCCEEEACFTVANGCMTFKVTTKEE